MFTKVSDHKIKKILMKLPALQKFNSGEHAQQFRGLQFLLTGNPYHFAGLSFADMHTDTYYALYNRVY